eukprot:5015820-Prymnesium_polylepis.1
MLVNYWYGTVRVAKRTSVATQARRGRCDTWAAQGDYHEAPQSRVALEYHLHIGALRALGVRSVTFFFFFFFFFFSGTHLEC